VAINHLQRSPIFFAQRCRTRDSHWGELSIGFLINSRSATHTLALFFLRYRLEKEIFMENIFQMLYFNKAPFAWGKDAADRGASSQHFGANPSEHRPNYKIIYVVL
jgi:hypothetical protein